MVISDITWWLAARKCSLFFFLIKVTTLQILPLEKKHNTIYSMLPLRGAKRIRLKTKLLLKGSGFGLSALDLQARGEEEYFL